MRVPMTANGECDHCGGSGIVINTELAPGVSLQHIRCGGGPVPQVTRRSLCPCVHAEPEAKDGDEKMHEEEKV